MEMRIVERRIGVGNRWVRCRMRDLRKGDRFRMFEKDGERVRSGRRSVFLCLSNPYQTTRKVAGESKRKRVWTVDTDY